MPVPQNGWFIMENPVFHCSRGPSTGESMLKIIQLIWGECLHFRTPPYPKIQQQLVAGSG